MNRIPDISLAKRILYGGSIVLIWALCYKAMGWIVAERDTMVLKWDIVWEAPIIPEAIVIYVSVYAMPILAIWKIRKHAEWKQIAKAAVGMIVITSVCYLCIPLTLPRPVLAHTDSWGAYWLNAMYRLDRPVNCFPSTHVALSCFSALWIRWKAPKWNSWISVWALLVGCSTIWIRQHYFVDVVSGCALALLLWHWFRPKTA